MIASRFLLAVLASCSCVAALGQANKTCTQVLERKAWYGKHFPITVSLFLLTIVQQQFGIDELTQNLNRHLLSNDEKTSYLNAELCLMKVPASHGLSTAKTLFDELQEAHQLLVNSIHFVVRCALCYFTPGLFHARSR